VVTRIQSFENSKGNAGVDEEGRGVRAGDNQAKDTARTGVGGPMGGLKGGLGGLKDAAIVSGADAAASLVDVQFTGDGPEIQFDSGSKITLRLKVRDGSSLAGLAAKPAEAPSAAPAAPQPVPAARADAAPAPAQAAAPPAAGQPNLTAVKADFIPGDKTLFFDDFSDMAGDDPPPHWKVRGASAALKVGGGIRQLTVTRDRGRLTPNLTGIPKNFTLEVEYKFENPGDLRSNWYFYPKGSDSEELRLWTQSHGSSLVLTVKTKSEELASVEPVVNFDQPVRLALWVQNGRLRVYVNDDRVVDVNQVNLPALDRAEMEVELYGDDTSAIGYRTVRFAESTPDFSQAISSTGRYVTYGIHFDTDSDRIKPESAAVVKSIARGLETNPALKLRIEGHTDSTGSADHNMDLSKRRADAVKAVLVSQFSADPLRLTTAGMGATKPVDTNDTPQGRSLNRRVELVRQ
jgi:outer membrane protein OmpA-like peptidoglycan-associated protein